MERRVIRPHWANTLLFWKGTDIVMIGNDNSENTIDHNK